MMEVTIGEIVNELLPYSVRIETVMSDPFPYVHALIVDRNHIVRQYIHTLQVKEHSYVIAIQDDETNGNKFIPTKNSSKPFIREKYFIDGESKETVEFASVEGKNFSDWLLRTLYQLNLIRFNPDDKYLRFADLGFNSPKIRRVIDKSFSSNHCKYGNISELLDVVNKSSKSFTLSNLLQKEVSCVNAKLRNLGLVAVIKDNDIVSIDYERR